MLQNYLNPNFSIINVHNNARIPGKLASYEIRIHGVTYPKIHEIICKKGYSGSVASLRMFMQKERTRMHERAYLAFFLIIFSKKFVSNAYYPSVPKKITLLKGYLLILILSQLLDTTDNIKR